MSTERLSKGGHASDRDREFAHAVVSDDRISVDAMSVTFPPEEMLGDMTAVEVYRDRVCSVARIAVQGVNRAVCNRECTITYEVLCGEGIMGIDGELYELRPGVVLDVFPGQAYQDAGQLVLRATSEPPFYLEQVEAAEQQLPLAPSEGIGEQPF